MFLYSFIRFAFWPHQNSIFGRNFYIGNSQINLNCNIHEKLFYSVNFVGMCVSSVDGAEWSGLDLDRIIRVG